MAETRKCPECGADLPSDSQGECVNCLLQLGLTVVAEPSIDPGLEPQAGIEQFGDYTLLSKIAEGGMGVVYKARQSSLKRLVALKMILSGRLAGEAEVRRFRTEAEAAANMTHPNIVPIYEIGEREGRHYFSMELIEGGDLADRIKDETWKVRDRVKLIATVAGAIHHAHQRGILHRDLKPSNILIDRQGQPHVTDFGLARRVEADANLTQSGAVMGTPNYMAPEQAMGQTRQMTTAVDVWSLGVILYQSITGQLPFVAQAVPEILRRLVEDEPRRPSTINRRIDRDLETICLKCLEKDPSRRYASADALCADLQHWLNGEPIAARPVRAWERAWKAVRRRPVTAALSAGVAISLLLGSLGIAWQRHRAEQHSQQADDQKTRRRIRDIEEHFRNDAHVALKELATLLREQPTNRICGERFLNTLSQRVFIVPSVKTLAVAPESLDSATNGKRRAVVRDKVAIEIVDSESGRVLSVLTNAHEAIIRSLRFSPDGSRLISTSGDQGGGGIAKIWDGSGKLLRELSHTQAVHYAEFSPQGDRFVTACLDGKARLWDLVREQPISDAMQHVNAAVNTARFSPDGRYVVTAADNGAMRVWDGMIGQPISEPIYLASSVDDARFSANGRYLIAFPKGGPSMAFLMTAGFVERVGPAPTRPQVIPLTASEQQLIAGHPGKPTSFDRTPDGAKLAVAFPDNTVMIWETRNRERTTEPLGHDAVVNCVRFSPDGLRVVTSTADRMVRVWDTSTGFPLCDWIRSVEPVAEVGWCADGSCITTLADWTWRVARMDGKAPDWLADLADALAGLGDPSGLVEPGGYLRVRQKILGSPDNGPIAQSVKAFLEDENLPTAP